jgi:peptidase M23-like protein
MGISSAGRTARLFSGALAASLICFVAWRAVAEENMTPLLLAVQDAPVPFHGSDGHVHLVYELWLSNFSSADVALEKVEVLGDGGAVVQSLGPAEIAKRLQPAGQRESSGTLSKGAIALLFLHVSVPGDAAVPRELAHRITVHAAAAPPGHQELTETGGVTTVDRQPVARIGPPLRGERYVSADSCCDATRHTRAALPVNGRVWVAQRYAVDWEQLDANGHIYSGPREKPESYTIYGKPAFAVADAEVVSVTNGQPQQAPGAYPTNISLDTADGNSIILDLGQQRFALYAHLQPGSIKVRQGEKVRAGQVLALVGNSGNSVAPHLHFQVMDRPVSLASNGLPYEIDDFQVAGYTPGTPAFDEAEEKGTVLAVSPMVPFARLKDAFPLDQLIIDFPARP